MISPYKNIESCGDRVKGLVTVITPIFNSHWYFRESLTSVRQQTHENWELLAIDDGTEAKVANDIKRMCDDANDTRIRYLRHDRNAGLAATRNTGLKNARGEFIAFLDHDDIWNRLFLERTIQAIRANHADFVFTRAVGFDDKTNQRLFDIGPTMDLWREFPTSLFMGNYITLSTVLMRASMIADLGTFSPIPKGCEDYDYWLRAAKTGKRFYFLAEDLCGYRVSNNQMSKNERLIAEGILSALQRNRSLRISTRLKQRRLSDAYFELAMIYAAHRNRFLFRALLGAALHWPFDIPKIWRSCKYCCSLWISALTDK